MRLLPEYREDVPRVERFNKVFRTTHWAHTITFIICLFSGLVLYVDGSWPWLAAIFGGNNGAGMVHRIAAVILTLVLIFFVIFDFKDIIDWIKDILRFGRNDIVFLLKFPLEFLGFDVKIPSQTRFNGGEKMNSVVTSTCVLLLVVSGYIMWFPEYFSVNMVRIAYPIHDIAMVIGTCMVCMHSYLGSFHPNSGESFWGMWKGTVREDWAEHHHKTWYDEKHGNKK